MTEQQGADRTDIAGYGSERTPVQSSAECLLEYEASPFARFKDIQARINAALDHPEVRAAIRASLENQRSAATEQQIDRDRLREDVEYAARLTGTCQADSARGYYPAMQRIFEAVPQLTDMLEKAEAERDWNFRSSRLAKKGRIQANARADQAEARIKAVRELHQHGGSMFDGALGDHTPVCASCLEEWPCPTIRALDGER